MLLMVVTFCCLNYLWMRSYRFGMLLDIDEAGYIALAVSYARAMIYGGISGWLHALWSPISIAPLTSTVASITMSIHGVSENTALLTNTVLEACLLIVVYATTRRLSDTTTALLAAFLVATTPLITDFSRNFQFAMGAALFFSSAVYFHLRSNDFEKRAPSILVGVCLALMTLSRTMAVAFLPVFAIVFLVSAALTTGIDVQRRRNILLAIGAFFLVAAPWYLRNFHNVFGYLFTFGYGAAASEYGSEVGIFTLANLASRIEALLGAFHAIHFFIVFPAFVCVLAVGIWNKFDFRKHNSNSIIYYYALLAFGCLFVLATSRNRGNGFSIPIMPLLVIVAAVGINLALRKTLVRNAIYILLLLASGVVGYASQDIKACSVFPQNLDMFGQGAAILFDCEEPIYKYITSNGVEGLVSRDTRDPSAPPNLDQDISRKWRDLSVTAADEISRLLPGGRGLVAYGSRHALFNTNTVSLEQIKRYGRISSAIQIEPSLSKNTQDDYLDWLRSGGGSEACVVVLLDSNLGEFHPYPNIEKMVEALTEAGYLVSKSVPTPTPGQHVNFWFKKTANCS
ncbi:ArnT family glycosyltransferase [Pleomorphomonas sp. PLEO]|uniref:ArnT family glycosyltransferase n=1 Tax=Pleomorphomonas sp. PLEO TaxID=3239306 RepID=UPI00351E6E6E